MGLNPVVRSTGKGTQPVKMMFPDNVIQPVLEKCQPNIADYTLALLYD